MSYSTAKTAPNTTTGCSAQIDGSRIVSFKNDYRVALVCSVTDPQKDPLSDERILMSNLFEIIPGIIPIGSVRSPSGNFTIQAPTLTISFFAVLVPRDAAWEKISTLGQLLKENGKILDPRYYK
jgi:hypothetical protein